MNKFNFKKFLRKRGYEEEIIKDLRGQPVIFNYQKKIYESPEGTPPDESEEVWNCITILPSQRFNASNAEEVIYLNRPIPTSRNEAYIITDKIEKYGKTKDSPVPDKETSPRENRD